MDRKIAIGVVTYNPSGNLISRLSLALASGFILYIFDNSPEDGIVQNFRNNRQTCRYFTCGKNVGLGFGISTVCAQAYYDSFPALIFFDQDTIFNRRTLDFIEDFYINNANIASNYSAIVFNSKNSGDCAGSNFIFKDVLLARSSGSLFFLENLKKLNWHNETYFVDCVDYGFCLNSNNNNLKIGECSMAPGFDHESEQPDVKYMVFGKERLLRKYSTKRIIDTIFASARLLITSVITKNIAFSVATIRSLAIYLYGQCVVRLINAFK